MAINFMHLLGRAPGLQSAPICIHLSPCWMGSSHSEKCSKCEAKPSGCKSEHPRADSIFTLYIFPRGTGVWSLPRCRGLQIVSPNPRPSICLSPLSLCLANEFIMPLPTHTHTHTSLTINATFDSVSRHAPPITLPWCHRISKLDYLTTSKWASKLISPPVILCKASTLPPNKPQMVWSSLRNKRRLSVDLEGGEIRNAGAGVEGEGFLMEGFLLTPPH